jgi:hypothetical protein
VAELETFIWKNGKPIAARSYNDDLIMTSAIACWVKETALTANTRDAAYKMAFLGAMSKSSMVLNTKIKGQHGYKKSEGKKVGEVEREMKDLKKHSWVLKG